jgi:uncharacterized SAM-binding protein YcdF (DUF218 family)
MEEVDHLVQILWDYNHLNHQLKPADCIFCLGSQDVLPADTAADLYLKGFAPYVIFSGNVGRLTKGLFEKPEAEIFADIARKRGVPESVIIEDKSTNTGENIQFTKDLLISKGINFNSFVLVQKPYMERRAYATVKKIWPEKEVMVTSPQVSMEEYFKLVTRPKKDVIDSMVADTQKIITYPAKGFQIPQEMPDEVWEACEQLVKLGYGR